MSDLSNEVALLNINATALLEKYDDCFKRLDDTGDVIKGEIEALIYDAENRLEISRVVSSVAVSGNNSVVNGYSTDFTFNAISYLDENVYVDKYYIDWGDGSSEEILDHNSDIGNIANHVFNDGSVDDTYMIKVYAKDTIGNRGNTVEYEVTITENNAPTTPTINTIDESNSESTFELTLSGSTDPDGDGISYELNSEIFTFSKTSNISENETILVTVPNLVSDTNATILANAKDSKGLKSTTAIKNITLKASSMNRVFGRMWCVSDDTYLRIGLDKDQFSAATKNEFESWLSPVAPRVNDNDVDIQSDLTNELDANNWLPFKNIKRYVVNEDGTRTLWDSVTEPTSTQQIMSRFEKTNYVHAAVEADGKLYDVIAASTTNFDVDLVNDLGLTNITSVILWSPTGYIYSGIRIGNKISSSTHPSFVLYNDTYIDNTFIGSFLSVSGRSIPNTKATNNITRAQARTQNESFGDDFQQYDFWSHSLVQLLAYIERGSNYMEGSGTKWDGYVSGSTESDIKNNGLTIPLGNKTGVIKDGANKVIANSYRTVENWHSNLWVYVDGININNGRIHLAKAGSLYSDDTDAEPYFDSGLDTLNSGSGLSIEKWLPGTFIPDPVSGGDNTTKVTDSMWGAAGWRVLYVGGALFYPGYSGPSAWYSGGDSSLSHWGIVSRSSFRCNN